MDDDDYVSSHYLEELYRCADKDTVAMSDAISFDDETRTQDENYGQHLQFLKLKDKDNVPIISARKLFNGPCMKLIQREILSNRKFEKQFANGEDSLYMFLISDRIKRLKFTSPEAIYYRRFRAGSAMTRKRSRLNVSTSEK